MLTTDIRDFINHSINRNDIIKQSATWYQLCSCLDMIENTERALRIYLKLKEPDQVGEYYLLVFGALQALVVQQDAVKHLCESLKLPYPEDPRLKQIREVRNNSIGHPTKRGRGKGKAFNFITEVTSSLSGFQLMTTFPDGKQTVFSDVNIRDLIEYQQGVFTSVMTDIVTQVKEEIMKHKHKYKDEKLQAIFSPQFNYDVQEIVKVIIGDKPSEMGVFAIDRIFKSISQFTEALKKRGENIENLEDDLEHFKYALSELMKYFDNEEESYLDNNSAYIFWFFLSMKKEELRQSAEDIDEKYETDL